MMCSTASVQVCLDAGEEDGPRPGSAGAGMLLHAIGPVLVAAFANSPLRAGHADRLEIDPPARLGPAGPEPHPGPRGCGAAAGRRRAGRPDPRAAWAAYVLDAEVMCVRRPASPCWTAPPGLTFRQWLRGPAADRPTASDLDYHLSTLFPPVRPRGHLELRVIDAQPGDGWIVPAALVTALVEDPAAGQAAMAAAGPLWPAATLPDHTASRGNGHPPVPPAPWLRAARYGLTAPDLARAARDCFAAADGALGRLGAPGPVRHAVARYADEYVLRGRCPADDRLDEARNGGVPSGRQPGLLLSGPPPEESS